MMNRFTTGIVAGGVLTALGVAYAVSDKKAKRKMIQSGKRMARKAEHAMNHAVDDMF